MNAKTFGLLLGAVLACGAAPSVASAEIISGEAFMLNRDGSNPHIVWGGFNMTDRLLMDNNDGTMRIEVVSGPERNDADVYVREVRAQTVGRVLYSGGARLLYANESEFSLELTISRDHRPDGTVVQTEPVTYTFVFEVSR